MWGVIVVPRVGESHRPPSATGTYAAGPDVCGHERIAFELDTTADRRESA